MFCGQCGAKLSDGDRFCAACGAALAGERRRDALVGAHGLVARDLDEPLPVGGLATVAVGDGDARVAARLQALDDAAHELGVRDAGELVHQNAKPPRCHSGTATSSSTARARSRSRTCV